MKVSHLFAVALGVGLLALVVMRPVDAAISDDGEITCEKITVGKGANRCVIQSFRGGVGLWMSGGPKSPLIAITQQNNAASIAVAGPRFAPSRGAVALDGFDLAISISEDHEPYFQVVGKDGKVVIVNAEDVIKAKASKQ